MIQAVIFDLYGTLFTLPEGLKDGALVLLEFCKGKGLKMAAVTSGNYDQAFLDQLGLSKYLNPVRCLSLFEKKEPKIFKEVLDELGVTPQQAVGVGDLLEKEIKSMHALGMTTIWLTSTSEADKPDEADYLVHDLQAVQMIIGKIN